MIENRTEVERPLSPHLQVYRLTITMVMSILHRITGGALYFGSILFVWWLLAAASPREFETFNTVAGSWLGQLVLLGYTWAVMHHMLGGLRHLFWDTGRGMEPGEREFLSWATLVGSVTLTAAIWIVALMARG